MSSYNFKNFANSFQAVAMLRLKAIECLLNHLGNPQKDLKFVHIAGTNGKGSVCSFLQSIFSAAGFRTGKYTSPNLVSVCERISVDGRLIPDDALNRILKTVEKGAELVRRDLSDYPTQFEIWTAAAFLYFKESACDIVILETGLGGTQDATNIIPPPKASVITHIDLDHQEYLGNTLKEIATEKAGIIKSHSAWKEGLTISAPQSEEVSEVLANTCKEKSNRLVFSTRPKLRGFEDFCEIFDYTSSDGKTIEGIKSGISGFYQTENAALAAETALMLGISPKFIKEGISSATHPGRFEIIQKDPIVIYDGAHNKDGIVALILSLKRYFPKWEGATFITSFMGDKDIGGSFDVLKASGLLDKSYVFTVQVQDNPRAASSHQISEIAKKYGIDSLPFLNLKTAYDQALEIGKPIILCGSLYLYKDFAEIIQR